MGHTPPSPASSIEGPAPLGGAVDTIPGASQLQPSAAPGEVVESYAQGHPRYTACAGEDFSTYNHCYGYPGHDEHMPPAGGKVWPVRRVDGRPPQVGYPRPDEAASGGLYGVVRGPAGYAPHTPYTPEMSPPVDDGITTRSGLTISQSRCSADARPAKRVRTGKKRKHPKSDSKDVSIDKPLSEFAKEFPLVSILDVAEYVNRPVSVRKQEEVNQGKVKRPLNDFVLYRKAFSGLIKVLLEQRGMTKEKQKNQQTVSKICGDSWNQETHEIKNRFKHLAGIERTKHGQAFPKYKYTPKPGKKQTKDGGAREEPAQDESRSHGASGRSAAAGESYRGPPEAEMAGPRGPYWPSGLVQPLAAFYGQGPPLHYPGPDYHDLQACDLGYMVGGPGNYATQPYLVDAGLGALPGPSSDLCIDPSLLPRVGEPVCQWLPRDDGLNGHRAWQPRPHGDGIMAVMPDLDIDGAHNAYLRGRQDDWQVEPLDETSHFNDWMAQEESTRI